MKTLHEILNNGLKRPINKQTKVLFKLIKYGSTNYFHYYGTCKRICELKKHGILVHTQTLQRKDEFGFNENYADYTLLNRSFAIELYKQLTK